MPDPLASREQWYLTAWASGPFACLLLGPVCCFPFQGTLLNQMGFQLADQFPGFDFDVQQRRLGMGRVPRRHFSNDLITHLFYALLVFHVCSAFPLCLPER